MGNLGVTPVCTLELYPFSQVVLRDLGCVASVYSVPAPQTSSNAQNLRHDLQFPLPLNFSQNSFFCLYQSVLVSMPCDLFALQHGQRGDNCYFVSILLLLLLLRQRGLLCIHCILKAHSVPSLFTQGCFSLATLICDLPLTDDTSGRLTPRCLAEVGHD